MDEEKYQPKTLVNESQNQCQTITVDAANLQSENIINEIVTNQKIDIENMKKLQAENVDLKAQLQAMANEIIKLKDDHSKEILEMTEKLKKFETKLAIYETSPKIFKLDVDCVQEIFDRLSIKDIHSISQTCNRMHRITSDYFLTNLAALELYNNGNHYGGLEMGYDKHRMNGFAEFVQKLTMGDSANVEEYRFVGLHCKSLKRVQFNHYSSELDANQIEYIKPILGKIETVQFLCHNISINYEGFLQFCPNIKNLTIYIQPNNEWMLRNYPTLEHLELMGYEIGDVPELKNFFNQNPSLKKFSTRLTVFSRNINSMRKSKIKLQVLDLLTSGKISENNFRRLNELHDQEFYKRLHLRFNGADQQSIDRISSVNWLDKLYLNGSTELLNLNSLIQLKELGLLFSYSSDPFLNDFESTAKSLVNLEHLYIEEFKLKMIEPFIEYAGKLKAIKISKFKEEKFINLSVLNKIRERLDRARKVTIYLEEDVYLPTKWGNKTTDFKMIDLKRAESCHWHNNYKWMPIPPIHLTTE